MVLLNHYKVMKLVQLHGLHLMISSIFHPTQKLNRSTGASVAMVGTTTVMKEELKTDWTVRTGTLRPLTAIHSQSLTTPS